MKLGDIVRDKISGFTGTVIADTMWIYGCRRLTVQSHELKDGRPLESVTFDAQQLEMVNHGAQAPAESVAVTGGPRPHPEVDVMKHDAPRR
jgi:hypothetical protein